VVNKFRGIAGPKDLPDEIYAKWEEGIQSVLKDPEFQDWYRAQSLVPQFMPHGEYAQFIDAFAEEQQDFFKQYGITE
jgi:tripartite-type tricarboxylate transporter receptor subunit TctC